MAAREPPETVELAVGDVFARGEARMKVGQADAGLRGGVAQPRSTVRFVREEDAVAAW